MTSRSSPSSRVSFSARVALSLLVALFCAACGGSSGAAGGNASGGGGGSGGPDAAMVQQKLLASVNGSAGGMARFAEFKEVDRKVEGEGDFVGCVMKFEGVIELTGDCEYYMKPRKAGDTVKFEAEAEFVKGKQGWQQVSLGLYPLEKL